MAENDQKLSEFSNLRIRYFTGQTYLASERYGQKVWNYRSYAFTKLGAIAVCTENEFQKGITEYEES